MMKKLKFQGEYIILFIKLINYYSIENIEDIDSRIIVTTGDWKNIIADSKIDLLPIKKKKSILEVIV